MKITRQLLKTVLFQANQRFGNGPSDIYTVPILRDVGISDYKKVIARLEEKGWISESGEPDYYRVTHTGEMVGTGQRCLCRECRPQDYR